MSRPSVRDRKNLCTVLSAAAPTTQRVGAEVEASAKADPASSPIAYRPRVLSSPPTCLRVLAALQAADVLGWLISRHFTPKPQLNTEHRLA